MSRLLLLGKVRGARYAQLPRFFWISTLKALIWSVDSVDWRLVWIDILRECATVFHSGLSNRASISKVVVATFPFACISRQFGRASAWGRRAKAEMGDPPKRGLLLGH